MENNDDDLRQDAPPYSPVPDSESSSSELSVDQDQYETPDEMEQENDHDHPVEDQRYPKRDRREPGEWWKTTSANYTALDEESAILADTITHLPLRAKCSCLASSN